MTLTRAQLLLEAELAGGAAKAAPRGPCLILSLVDDTGPEPLLWSLPLPGGLDAAAERYVRALPPPGFVDARICAAALVDFRTLAAAAQTAADWTAGLSDFTAAAWPGARLQHVVVIDRAAEAWCSMRDGLARWIGGTDLIDQWPPAEVVSRR